MTKENAHEFLEMIGIANRNGCYDAADIFQDQVTRQKAVIMESVHRVQKLAKDMPQLPQRQDSTQDQLEDLIPLAKSLNLNEAANFMTMLIQ